MLIKSILIIFQYTVEQLVNGHRLGQEERSPLADIGSLQAGMKTTGLLNFKSHTCCYIVKC